MPHDVLIPLFAIAMPMILVASILGLKHLARRREWQHVERLRAIERGRTVPGSHAWAAAVCLGVGTVVPVAALGLAWMASLTVRDAAEGAWFAAAVVGLTGVVSGTRLAGRLLAADAASAGEAAAGHQPDPHAKPRLDPDLFDVVARRG